MVLVVQWRHGVHMGPTVMRWEIVIVADCLGAQWSGLGAWGFHAPGHKGCDCNSSLLGGCPGL